VSEAGPRRAAGVAYEIVDGQAVVMDPDGTELVTLNEVGTLVFEALDGRDLDALVDDLLPELEGVTRDELARDVADFVTELRDAGLVDAEESGA
jgi:hypothetical protein